MLQVGLRENLMKGSTAPVILCVDDDKVTLRGLERALVNNGYSVLTASSAAQALTTLQHTKPALILLDAIMPDMDGYVTKPLRPEELYTLLEDIAARRAQQEVVPPEETLDRKELFALLDSDITLLTELTDIFWENSPDLAAQMRSALADRDPHTLIYAAHTLKGAVGNFAAHRALALITELETIGATQNFSQATRTLDVLEAELACLHTALSSLREELAA
jgi:HPt (histidine-containing phosphotransfer) domain-containing protein